MKRRFTHLATRIFNQPLALNQAKLNTILAVLGPRTGWLAATEELEIEPEDLPLDAVEELVAETPPPTTAVAGNMAVIPIHGTLMKRVGGMEVASGAVTYAAISTAITSAVNDPNISGILLDIDSPGGEISGLFDLVTQIRQAKTQKPLWAIANDAALSAAYAIAAATGRIIITNMSAVGSIGVIAMHVDESGRDATEGLRYTPIFAGARKNDLSPHEPLSDQAKAALQTEVNRVYGLLVASVASDRGLTTEAVMATEGAVIYGDAAIAMQLADALGSIDSAVKELKAIASQPTPPQIPPAAATEPAPAPAVEPPPEAPTEPPALASRGWNGAIEVAQLCTIAGRTELIAEYLRLGLSAEAVRAQLLRTKQASPVITSYHHNHSDQDLMVNISKRLAQQHPAKRTIT